MGRIDCSNVLNYAKERKRMCDTFSVAYGRRCGECPLFPIQASCVLVSDFTEAHIDAVQKWSDEHPVRDFKQELLALKIAASYLNTNERFKDNSFMHYNEPMDGANIPELLFNLIERLEKGGAEHD